MGRPGCVEIESASVGRGWGILLGVLVLVGGGAARAETDSKPVSYALGPSVAAVVGEGRSALGVGLDFTWIGKTGARPPAWWVTVGFRGRFRSDGQDWLPYAEVGTWLLLNLGAGISLRLPALQPEAHLFLGLPIPLCWQGCPTFMALEPYYRPSIGAVVTHEVGLLLKVSHLDLIEGNPFR